MRFFVNGPFKQGYFTFGYLLDPSDVRTYRLECNGIYYVLTASAFVCYDSIAFSDLLLPSQMLTDIVTVQYAVTWVGGILFTGSIPYIPVSYMGTLRFGFLSCNDNPHTIGIEGNTYHAGHDAGLFGTMQTMDNHLIIHLGDNVYADSVWEAFSSNQIDSITATSCCENTTYDPSVRTHKVAVCGMGTKCFCSMITTLWMGMARRDM